MLALRGLTGGHGHKCVPLLEAALSGTVSMGVFHRRVTRVVDVVLIPMLTACRKLAMRLLWWKKGVNHDKIGMVRGCRFGLFPNGIGGFE
jgi:hypothetical protein